MLRTNGASAAGYTMFSDGFEASPRRFADRNYGAPPHQTRDVLAKRPARRHSAGRGVEVWSPAKPEAPKPSDWLCPAVSPSTKTLEGRIKDVRNRLMPVISEAAARIAQKTGADVATIARAVERHLADATRALDLPATAMSPEAFKGYLFRGMRHGDEVATFGRGATSGSLAGWAAEMRQKLVIFEVLADRAGRPDTAAVRAFQASIESKA
ncbi:MAG: hypothetical protein HY791_39125 [Deltaproteobacteria bacterium]|nr:hypothetical protein [Deltaproteobacteria bacterium]